MRVERSQSGEIRFTEENERSESHSLEENYHNHNGHDNTIINQNEYLLNQIPNNLNLQLQSNILLNNLIPNSIGKHNHELPYLAQYNQNNEPANQPFTPNGIYNLLNPSMNNLVYNNNTSYYQGGGDGNEGEDHNLTKVNQEESIHDKPYPLNNGGYHSGNDFTSQLQQLQHIQQLQQLQHLQQLQQLQQQRHLEESDLNNESGLDANVFDLLQQQLQLQVQLDLQRQQQIKSVVDRSRPNTRSNSVEPLKSVISPPPLGTNKKVKEGKITKSISKVKRSISSLSSSNIQREFKCPHCKWVFNRHSDLTRHLKSHNEPEYHCPFWHPEYETCPHKNKGSFSRLDILKRHLKLVHFHVFKNSNEQDSRLKRRNGGECLSCGGVFLTMKDFIDHVGDCALNNPMEKWRYKKNGVIVNVSKELDDGLDALNEEEEEQEEEKDINKNNNNIMNGNFTSGDNGSEGNDPNVYGVPSLGILANDPNNYDSYLLGTSSLTLKKRTSNGDGYSETGDHRTIVQNVIPALKRPRGRPKKYT